MRAWMLPAGSDGFDKLYLEELWAKGKAPWKAW